MDAMGTDGSLVFNHQLVARLPCHLVGKVTNQSMSSNVNQTLMAFHYSWLIGIQTIVY